MLAIGSLARVQVLFLFFFWVVVNGNPAIASIRNLSPTFLTLPKEHPYDLVSVWGSTTLAFSLLFVSNYPSPRITNFKQRVQVYAPPQNETLL